MADKNLSQVIGSVGGAPKLAPDLTWPSDKINGTQNYETLTGIAVTPASLSTVISLTGKFIVHHLNAKNLIAEAMTWKLTIDGEVKWNSVGKSQTSELLLGGIIDNTVRESMQCDSSLLLEVNTTSDTSIDLDYLARPIE